MKMCGDCKDKHSSEIDVDTFAFDILKEQIKTTKRFFIVCMILLAVNFASVGTLFYLFNNYDFGYQVVNQSGEGTNIIGEGNEVNNNGSNSQNNDDDTQGWQETPNGDQT